MSVKVQVSQVIDRPVADVFNFHANEHVRNHPRWDPFMQLEQVTEGPMSVGTIIRRRSTRSGTPVEGTMEVVEFEPNRSVGMVIQDGPVKMIGRASYVAESDDRTLLMLYVELPGMEESMDTSMLTSGIQESLRNVKHLIESEVNK